MSKKYLFIDDNKEWLASIQRALRGKDNVLFAECHRAQEALDAVAKIQPDVIFLDHSLTEGGDEGLEIVKALQGSGVKIYSLLHTIICETFTLSTMLRWWGKVI